MTAYERKGEFAKAIDDMERAGILWGQNAAKQVGPLRDAYAKHGAMGYWQNRFESLKAGSPHGIPDPYQLAVLLARLGEKDRVFASLEQSYAGRSTELLYSLQGEPAFDSLRNDPRFQELLRRVGGRPTSRA